MRYKRTAQSVKHFILPENMRFCRIPTESQQIKRGGRGRITEPHIGPSIQKGGLVTFYIYDETLNEKFITLQKIMVRQMS